MTSDLRGILRRTVDQRSEQIAGSPIGDFGPVIDDLVIPTDDPQDDAGDGVYVSFATYARHQIIRPNRLSLPDWLKVHRAGDVTIVCVVVASDFILPISWCWAPSPVGHDQTPQRQRLILATLSDGQGLARLQRDTGEIRHVELPPSRDARWLHALHETSVTYLSRRPSNSILGDESRFGPRR